MYLLFRAMLTKNQYKLYFHNLLLVFDLTDLITPQYTLVLTRLSVRPIMLNQSVHSIHKNLSKSVMKLEYSLIHVQNIWPIKDIRLTFYMYFNSQGYL